MITENVNDAISVIGMTIFGVMCMSVLLMLYLSPVKFSNFENSLENAI